MQRFFAVAGIRPTRGHGQQEREDEQQAEQIQPEEGFPSSFSDEALSTGEKVFEVAPDSTALLEKDTLRPVAVALTDTTPTPGEHHRAIPTSIGLLLNDARNCPFAQAAGSLVKSYQSPAAFQRDSWIFLAFDLLKSWDAFATHKSGYDRRYFYDLFTTRWPVIKFLALWFQERMVRTIGRGNGAYTRFLLDEWQRDLEARGERGLRSRRGGRECCGVGRGSGRDNVVVQTADEEVIVGSGGRGQSSWVSARGAMAAVKRHGAVAYFLGADHVALEHGPANSKLVKAQLKTPAFYRRVHATHLHRVTPHSDADVWLSDRALEWQLFDAPWSRHGTSVHAHLPAGDLVESLVRLFSGNANDEDHVEFQHKATPVAAAGDEEDHRNNNATSSSALGGGVEPGADEEQLRRLLAEAVHRKGAANHAADAESSSLPQTPAVTKLLQRLAARQTSSALAALLARFITIAHAKKNLCHLLPKLDIVILAGARGGSSYGSFTVRGRQVARGLRKFGRVKARAWNFQCRDYCDHLMEQRAQKNKLRAQTDRVRKMLQQIHKVIYQVDEGRLAYETPQTPEPGELTPSEQKELWEQGGGQADEVDTSSERTPPLENQESPHLIREGVSVLVKDADHSSPRAGPSKIPYKKVLDELEGAMGAWRQKKMDPERAARIGVLDFDGRYVGHTIQRDFADPLRAALMEQALDQFREPNVLIHVKMPCACALGNLTLSRVQHVLDPVDVLGFNFTALERHFSAILLQTTLAARENLGTPMLSDKNRLIHQTRTILGEGPGPGRAFGSVRSVQDARLIAESAVGGIISGVGGTIDESSETGRSSTTTSSWRMLLDFVPASFRNYFLERAREIFGASSAEGGATSSQDRPEIAGLADLSKLAAEFDGTIFASDRAGPQPQQASSPANTTASCTSGGAASNQCSAGDGCCSSISSSRISTPAVHRHHLRKLVLAKGTQNINFFGKWLFLLHIRLSAPSVPVPPSLPPSLPPSPSFLLRS